MCIRIIVFNHFVYCLKARIKAHPIPRTSVSTTPINLVNRIQTNNEIILVNPTPTTVLQQATTPVPVYTPNSTDSQTHIQVAQTQIPQTQYHPRLYSQPAMYPINQVTK
jgi:hypothetical protein